MAGVSVMGMAFAGAAYAGPVTDADLLNDANNPKSVLTNGMGLQGHRFSPLKLSQHRQCQGPRSGLVLLLRR